MSGFVCVFLRNRSSIKPAIVQRMLSRLNHRGPDGADLRFFPSGAVGHQHFWTTPEEVDERQPLSDTAGRYVVVFDGRLDNRAELLSALACQNVNISDSTLILLAYTQWGEACFARMLGPLAIVLVDTVQRRVVCMRDALGDRTLFYYVNSRILLVASEEQALLAHPLLSLRLNESRLAAFFALDVPGDGSTFFADVSELLPAHVMVVDENTVQIRRYWEPEPRAAIRYRSDADYGEHFHALLMQSVTCRLRGPSPPVMMMSGGLDSTSVAALAAQRLSKGNAHNALRAFSYVFDELPSCDERPFIAMMYAQHAIDGIHIPGDDAWPLREVTTWPNNPNTPDNNPYRWLKERVYVAAQRSGSRVVLTGIFGDELYSGSEYWLRDLFREARFAQAWQESLWHIHAYGLWNGLRTPMVHCLPGIQRFHRLLRMRHRSWLTSYARSRMRIDEEWSLRVYAASRPSQFDTLLGPYSATDATGEIFHASRCGVELRHPYRDRRLIEFMLAIPASQLYRKGSYKHILRTAMRNILPQQIYSRQQPTSLTPLYRRGLVEKEHAVVKELLYGTDRLWPRYVRADWLTQAKPGQHRTEAEELVLWLCVSCELWRQHLMGMGVKGEIANSDNSS